MSKTFIVPIAPGSSQRVVLPKPPPPAEFREIRKPFDPAEFPILAQQLNRNANDASFGSIETGDKP